MSNVKVPCYLIPEFSRVGAAFRRVLGFVLPSVVGVAVVIAFVTVIDVAVVTFSALLVTFVIIIFAAVLAYSTVAGVFSRLLSQSYLTGTFDVVFTSGFTWWCVKEKIHQFGFVNCN